MQKKSSFFKTTTTIFLLLCILFIPFPFHLITFQSSVTDFFFGKLIGTIASSIFGVQLKNTIVYSDSISMYVLVLLLSILSLMIGLLLHNLNPWKHHQKRIVSFLSILFSYYLVLMLMKYGLDKVFKTQFYLPEPNTLYTPLGQIEKDLLYWTSMGTSRGYNIFTGSIEVLAALLIFFKRTRMSGLLLATASLTHIVAVNFGFDISVKLYSLFLLSLSLFLLTPYCRRLYSFFFSQQVLPVMPAEKNDPTKNIFLSLFLKFFITGLILFESLYPYVRDNNFNDDTAKRPFLHGAYEVQQMITATDTLSGKNAPLRRFFIHRENYLIFQNQADAMQDYKLSYDADRHTYILTDYQQRETKLSLEYQEADSILVLNFFKDGQQHQLTGKAIDWKKLPLLQRSFHWTIDSDR